MPTRIAVSTDHQSQRFVYHGPAPSDLIMDWSHRFGEAARRERSKAPTTRIVPNNTTRAMALGLTAASHKIAALAAAAKANFLPERPAWLKETMITTAISANAPANTIGFSRFGGRK